MRYQGERGVEGLVGGLERERCSERGRDNFGHHEGIKVETFVLLVC